MAIEKLSQRDQQVIAECLDAILSGVFIDDVEFQITAGVTFAEVARVRAALPDVDDSLETVALVINGALNDLLGYPHRQEARWADFISVPTTEVSLIFRRWREAKDWTSDGQGE